MAELKFSTPDTIGPIRDNDSRRVCSLVGIETARKKIFSLRQLRDGLDFSIRELESQRRKDQIINKALVVTRFTKATCDAFISMAGALGEAFIPKKEGGPDGFWSPDKVAAGYAALAPAVEAATTSYVGGKADWAQVGITVANEGISLVARDNKVMSKDAVEILAKSTVVKAELIKGAMNHEKEGLIKPAVVYIYDLNTKVAEMTGGKGKAGAALAKVAKSAFEYNEQIGKAFDQMIDDDMESRERAQALKSTFAHLAKMLSKQVEEMEQFVNSCEYEIARSEQFLCVSPQHSYR